MAVHFAIFQGGSLSRLGGLDEARQRCLIELTGLYGRDAKTRLKTIRDEPIWKFEHDSIMPEEQHNRVTQPAVAAIEAAFDDFV